MQKIHQQQDMRRLVNKMGDRYYITGVQLGILMVNLNEESNKKILKEIEQKQFIATITEDEKDKLKIGVVKI